MLCRHRKTQATEKEQETLFLIPTSTFGVPSGPGGGSAGAPPAAPAAPAPAVGGGGAGKWQPKIPTGPRTMKVGKRGDARSMPAAGGSRVPVCNSCNISIRYNLAVTGPGNYGAG